MFTEGIYPIGDGLLDIDENRLKGLLVPHDINEIYDVEQTPFARGKFAAVRRAVHKNSGVHFAAKFLKRRRRAQSSDKEIKHEIAVLMLCEGADNIVKLNAVHESRSDTALLLELATGGELQTFLDNEECLSEAQARTCMREVLKALQFLHKRSIVHLDLKPQNILLTGERIEDGLKLCDFGISRVVAEGTNVREIVGTPDYVAPEVLQYEPLSLMTDIWSVGVLTYVLLSGFSPFGGETKQETFLNISQCALTFPDKLFGGVSAAAIDFMRRALRIKPSDRMTAAACLEHVWLKDDCAIERTISFVASNNQQQNGTKDADAHHSSGSDVDIDADADLEDEHMHQEPEREENEEDDDECELVEEEDEDEEEELDNKEEKQQKGSTPQSHLHVNGAGALTEQHSNNKMNSNSNGNSNSSANNSNGNANNSNSNSNGCVSTTKAAITTTTTTKTISHYNVPALRATTIPLSSVQQHQQHFQMISRRHSTDSNKENTYLATKHILPTAGKLQAMTGTTRTPTATKYDIVSGAGVSTATSIATIIIPASATGATTATTTNALGNAQIEKIITLPRGGQEEKSAIVVGAPCLFPDAPTTPKVIRKTPNSENSPTSVKALVKKFQLEGKTMITADSSAVACEKHLKEQQQQQQQEQHRQHSSHVTTMRTPPTATAAATAKSPLTKLCVKLPGKVINGSTENGTKKLQHSYSVNNKHSNYNYNNNNTNSNSNGIGMATRRCSEPIACVHKKPNSPATSPISYKSSATTTASISASTTTTPISATNSHTNGFFGITSNGKSTNNGCRHSDNGMSNNKCSTTSTSSSNNSSNSTISSSSLLLNNHHNSINNYHHHHQHHQTHHHHHPQQQQQQQQQPQPHRHHSLTHHHHVVAAVTGKGATANSLSLDQGIIC